MVRVMTTGRGRALRFMAILQALLEPLALSASGYERMINGWTAASGGTGTGQARTGQNWSGQAPSIGTDRGNEAPGATWRVKARPRNRNWGRGLGFSLARVFAFPRLPTQLRRRCLTRASRRVYAATPLLRLELFTM